MLSPLSRSRELHPPSCLCREDLNIPITMLAPLTDAAGKLLYSAYFQDRTYPNLDAGALLRDPGH